MKKKIIILIAIVISILIFIFGNMYTAIPSAKLTVDYNKIENHIISLSDNYKENKENFKTFVAIKDLGSIILVDTEIIKC